MFAALTFERDPLALTWNNFWDALASWVQTVGGFAAFGLLLWLIAYALARRGGSDTMTILARLGGAGGVGVLLVLALLFGPLGIVLLLFLYVYRRSGTGFPELRVAGPQRRSVLTTALFIGAVVWAALGYLLWALLYVPEVIDWMGSEGGAMAAPAGWRRVAQNVLFTVAGASAIFAVLLPILADLPRLSGRRIWALAQLSFKEAVRRKVLWVFLALLLVVLFGSWFIPAKYEDEVRNYVQVISLAQALLLLLAALLLASFGVPDDIRHQTIHTVLTKPVERFEIFLGRFLGYAALMTLVLVVVSGLGLLYVLRGVSEEAAAESLKARVPLYGELEFEGTDDPVKGENVGREWEYRGYIFGPVPSQPTQYAVWNFRDLPSGLAERDKVRCEFTFDIYRTTKGVEGQGVFCTFFVETWRYDPSMKAKYDEARQKGRGDPDIEDKLAEEFGYYEFPSKEVQDFHTQSIDLPPGIIKNALGRDDARRKELERRRGGPPAPLRLRVKCESRTQFVGMAKYDLYLRQDDPEGGNDRLRFCLNYFKGGFGLWLRLCLIVGLAVALSTYLSGVITFLTTLILYGLGFFRDFMAEVAFRRNVGGGPLEAALRLVRRPGGESLAVPLEETTAVRVATGSDDVFGWLMRRVMDLIPDVTRFSFTDFVAEGVAIGGGQMLFAFLIMLGYLLPWAVLAYYLLRWREVASST
jgi:hypothetical protein